MGPVVGLTHLQSSWVEAEGIRHLEQLCTGEDIEGRVLRGENGRDALGMSAVRTRIRLSRRDDLASLVELRFSVFALLLTSYSPSNTAVKRGSTMFEVATFEMVLWKDCRSWK